MTTSQIQNEEAEGTFPYRLTTKEMSPDCESWVPTWKTC